MIKGTEYIDIFTCEMALRLPVSFPTKQLLKRGLFLQRGAISFTLELTSFRKRGKKNFTELAPTLESISIPLKRHYVQKPYL